MKLFLLSSLVAAAPAPWEMANGLGPYDAQPFQHVDQGFQPPPSAQPFDNRFAQPIDNRFAQPIDNRFAQPIDNRFAQPFRQAAQADDTFIPWISDANLAADAAADNAPIPIATVRGADAAPIPKLFQTADAVHGAVALNAVAALDDTALADSVSDTANTIISPLRSGVANIGATDIVTAIILIAAGFLFVFWGSKLFKPILFIAGFFFFAVITYSVLGAIERSRGAPLFGDSRALVFLILVLVIGFIGGLLFVFLWRLGLSAIGALLGLFLGLFILSLVNGGAISSGTGRTIFLIVLAVVGAILIHLIEKPVLILGTAFPGSYAMFIGIDVFANTGFIEAAHAFLGGQGLYATSTAVYGMIAGMLVTAVIGCIVQWRNPHEKGTYYQRANTNAKY